jgi:sialate O-acetylesterase
MKRFAILFLFVLPLVSSAKVRLPAIFSDHLVLQQNYGNPIWGWAQPGEKVTVSTSWGEEHSLTTGENGKWMAVVYAPAASLGHKLTIRGSNRIVLRNVAVGEVWLCAGQSNMGWSVGNSFEAEGEAEVDLPGFRIYRSAREHWHEPLEENRDRLARWKPCDPQSAAETSAVSYYFGKKLHQELKVPVGIIQRAFAGTPIEGWMPWEIQISDPRTMAFKKQLDEGSERLIARGQTKQKAIEAHQLELAEYNAKIDRGETMKNAFRPLSPPIITKPSNLGHQYPGHIYNAMIAPIRPYAIRGMIWYQGERNAKNAPQAEHYHNQLQAMIGYYRNSWFSPAKTGRRGGSLVGSQSGEHETGDRKAVWSRYGGDHRHGGCIRVAPQEQETHRFASRLFGSGQDLWVPRRSSGAGFTKPPSKRSNPRSAIRFDRFGTDAGPQG